jgi:hypothetical protein
VQKATDVVDTLENSVVAIKGAWTSLVQVAGACVLAGTLGCESTTAPLEPCADMEPFGSQGCAVVAVHVESPAQPLSRFLLHVTAQLDDGAEIGYGEEARIGRFTMRLDLDDGLAVAAGDTVDVWVRAYVVEFPEDAEGRDPLVQVDSVRAPVVFVGVGETPMLVEYRLRPR